VVPTPHDGGCPALVLPNIQELLHIVGDEGLLWCMAGAANLQELLCRVLLLSLKAECHGKMRKGSGEVVDYIDARRFNLQYLSPMAEDKSFECWWSRGNVRASDLVQRGFSSLVILGGWTLWKHRNTCVFEGVVPSMARVLLLAMEETHLCILAGARGLSLLTALEPI
ncbi:hypothetical protein U9M48_025058, partial [Paspalum notatum var. saurae]